MFINAVLRLGGHTKASWEKIYTINYENFKPYCEKIFNKIKIVKLKKI